MNKKQKKGGWGGKRKGAGSRAILAGLADPQKVMALLNEAAPMAVATLMACLKSKNAMIRMRAASEILRKVIPDRKEIRGSVDGEPIRIILEHETVHGNQSTDPVPPDAGAGVSTPGAV